MTQATAGLDQIGRVMVAVSDQDAAIAFYTEKLGFELRADVPYGDEADSARWVEVGLGDAPTGIALVTPPEGSDGGPGGHSGIALTTQDIDGCHAAFTAAGIDVDDEIARHGDPVPPMFWFRDQDQNIHLVVQNQES